MKAEASARAANKKEFLDKMATMSAHVESLKVQRQCHPSIFSIGSLFCILLCLLAGTSSKHAWQGHAHLAGWKARVASKSCALLSPSVKPVPCTMARPCWSLAFQESLETAERECKESAGVKEALRSQLSKAAAAEDSSRAQCEQLEAQAASTAAQVQELRQQVSVRAFAPRLSTAPPQTMTF